MNLEIDTVLLPYILDEDIYVIGHIEVLFTEKPIQIQPVKPEIEVQKVEIKAPEVEVEIEKNAEKEFEKSKNTKPKINQHFKAIILVGYQGTEGTPTPVMDAINKTFIALKINQTDLKVINVLDKESQNLEEFTFQNLILMGGNGKKLSFLSDYPGKREPYTIIDHKGIGVFFAESMDTYFLDKNLKTKFWGKLKEMFL